MQLQRPRWTAPTALVTNPAVQEPEDGCLSAFSQVLCALLRPACMESTPACDAVVRCYAGQARLFLFSNWSPLPGDPIHILKAFARCPWLQFGLIMAVRNLSHTFIMTLAHSPVC